MKKLEALKTTDINIQQFFEIDNRWKSYRNW